MNPIDNPALENLHQRTTQMLIAIDTTPPENIDHIHHQHSYEELRLLVEEWQTNSSNTQRILPQRVWEATAHMFTGEGVTALVPTVADVTVTPHTLHSAPTDDQIDQWRQL